MTAVADVAVTIRVFENSGLLLIRRAEMQNVTGATSMLVYNFKDWGELLALNKCGLVDHPFLFFFVLCLEQF